MSGESGWHVVRGSALEHPNIVHGRTVIAGGPSRAWIEDVRGEWGEDSAYYTARVLGQFPEEGLEDALVQRTWLDRSRELHRRHELVGRSIVLGLDPARLGPDMSALCVRQGRHVHDFTTWRGADTMATADRLMAEVRRHMREAGQVDEVWTDEVGLGAGVLDRLKELLPKLAEEAFPRPLEVYEIAKERPPSPYRRPPKARGFDASKRAGRPERFLNLRAQAYWTLRKLLEEGKLALPPNAELDGELLAMKVKFTTKGQVQIERKEDLKKRIGRSPDLADSLVISLAPLVDRGGKKTARLIA